MTEPRRRAYLSAMQVVHWLPRAELPFAAPSRPELLRVPEPLVEAPVVLRTARTYSQDDLRQSARDHDELVAAFAARDPDWARAVMGSHLRRAFHTFAKTVGPRADDAANDQDSTET